MASAMAVLTVQLLLLHLLGVVGGFPPQASYRGWFLLPALLPAVSPASPSPQTGCSGNPEKSGQVDRVSEISGI
jgi:hypothetical protein